MTDVYRWSEADARTFVEQAKNYAGDSPYSYATILKIGERLAGKKFKQSDALATIRSCGDAVAVIDGNDYDLTQVVLLLAELRTTRDQGYLILSELNDKGILVFELLGKMTGKSPEWVKNNANHNALDWKVVSQLIIEAFDSAYGGLAHKIVERRKRSSP